MHEYVQLEGNIVKESRGHWRRILAVCCGVVCAGVVVVLYKIGPGELSPAEAQVPSEDQQGLNLASIMPGISRQGMHFAVQKPPIMNMAPQHLQPARASLFPQFARPVQFMQPSVVAQAVKNPPVKKDLTEYTVKEALMKIKAKTNAKFDETIDVAVNLGVDHKKSDQSVRGVTILPAGTGKTVRVAVFAKGDKVAEAEEAGADIVGGEDLQEKIKNGEVDFDRCIATPDMMGVVGRVAPILGPKGLMPNLKLGTVTMDVAAAVKASKGGQVEYRADTGVIHAGIGKFSFSEEDLEENLRSFMAALAKAKPQAAKGQFIKKVFLSSTMGKSYRIAVSEFAR